MNTMVILVNEHTESRAALDWTLKGQARHNRSR